ncbi:MAG TPA: DnaA/Hda family protein [Spirochaetota bacterium]|nr:DnaA/Hda family protein [Spirochaetota bacterium]
MYDPKKLSRKKFIISSLAAGLSSIVPAGIISHVSNARAPEKFQGYKINSVNYNRVNPDWSFDNFIVCPGNEVAYTAARSVAHSPGGFYNPLFIYGDTSFGTTHLMFSIVNHLSQNNPLKKCLYVSSDNFISELINSIRTNRISSFKNKYQNVDILLFDIFSFLEWKEQTQNEIYSLFNNLSSADKQIVIGCSKSPGELSGISSRFISFIKGGLVVEIGPPDLDAKRKYLKSMAVYRHLDVPDNVIEYIALNAGDNFRVLYGIIMRHDLYSRYKNMPVDIDMAKEILKPYMS